MSRVSSEQYDRWLGTLFVLLGEVEEAHGDNAAGTYPNEVEMLLSLAVRACRRQREYARAVSNCEQIMASGEERTTAQTEQGAA